MQAAPLNGGPLGGLNIDQMETQRASVRDSYDSAASAYADHLFTELDQKPLDRHLLNRFAEAARGRGLVADLGCEPGHISKYLHEQGVSVVGVDLSPEMIRVAGDLSPGIDFRVGDQVVHVDDSLCGARRRISPFLMQARKQYA